MSDIKSIIESNQGSDEITQILLEANEMLKAQGIVKGVLFKALKLLDPIMKDLLSRKVITSFKPKISPYNNGYELRFNVKTNTKYLWELTDLDDSYEPLAKILYEMHSMYFQPSSWFFAEENSENYLEGSTLNVHGDYPRFKGVVANKGDIKRVANDYFEQFKKELKVLKGANDETKRKK